MIHGMSEYSQHYDTAPATVLRPQHFFYLDEVVEAVAEVPLSSTFSCEAATESLKIA